jgi:hypothetical protein
VTTLSGGCTFAASLATLTVLPRAAVVGVMLKSVPGTAWACAGKVGAAGSSAAMMTASAARIRRLR